MKEATVKTSKWAHLTLVALLVLLAIPFGFASGQKGKESSVAKQVVLHVAHQTHTLGLRDFWAKFKPNFEREHPNYVLEIEGIPIDSSPEQFYKVKLAAGEFPDVGYVFQPALLISSKVIREIPQELVDMLIDPNYTKVGGKIYTIPIMKGLLGMWYNKDIFKKAGIAELPANWKDFIAALGKIKSVGIEPIGMAASAGWYVAGFFDFLWAPLVYGPQPNWPALRSQGKVKFNNPVTKRAIEMFAETIPYWQKGALSATYDQIKGLFMNQEVAIMANGGIYNASEIESGELKPAFDIGYLVPPQDKPEARRVNFFADNLYVISAKIEGAQLRAAIDYLKFFFGPKQYGEFLNATGNLPTMKGFESFAPNYQNPKAKSMAVDIAQAANKYGFVAHAHATQGDNIWPEGCREMSEKIVQEIAAGNRDYNVLMNLLDNQWDIGVQQAK
jgi:raffinose/stachyose/melibiose transport system substrate-binding protein